MKFTDTQIISAVEYVLNGVKADLTLPEDANATEEELKRKQELEEVYEIPTQDQSMAKQILLQALSQKMPAEVAKYALLDDLERMVMVAAMHDNSNILKNEHTKAASKFYIAAGRIHERLVAEKKKLEEEEKK
jgi:hypothetical protein